MQRRQGILFESSERVVIEDYAHHPTEIASILRMRGELLPDHKLKVVFQPHRYSRTKAFAPSFAEELSHADELYLLQTYAAFEPYDQLGTVESLSGYLPPRLREIQRSIITFAILGSQLVKTLK